jgi:23S rRNA U2552 (ribose-2'-O)-methylase RlmE/FtsJ
MNYEIKFGDNSKINLEEVNIKVYLEDKNKCTIFKKYYDTISVQKEKIDSINYNKKWDKIKKIGNPYELVYTSLTNKKKNDNISSYIPISRSYYKMWEILQNFKIIDKKTDKSDKTDKKKIYIANLAEGPGGFMEAIYNFNKKYTNNSDYYYGITIKPYNQYVPDWNKLIKIFGNENKKINNIDITYGNLYIHDDVNQYINKLKDKKIEIVTADGGFDYSADFNGQEINSCQIIYSEVIIGINLLIKGGSMICKIFDIFSITTIRILYIIYNLFESVHIFKPDTSRPANSEKYLVCLNYLDNISENKKKEFLEVIKDWYVLNENNKNTDKIINIDLDIKIPGAFLHAIDNFNELYMNRQLLYLENTLKISDGLDKNEFIKLKNKQINIAKDWCTKYDIKINKNYTYAD